MTATEIHSSSSDIKVCGRNSPRNAIISIAKRPILYLEFDKRQRGGQSLGKYHRVQRIFIDKENRAYAEIMLTDESGSSYFLAPFGHLQEPLEGG